MGGEVKYQLISVVVRSSLTWHVSHSFNQKYNIQNVYPKELKVLWLNLTTELTHPIFLDHVLTYRITAIFLTVYEVFPKSFFIQVKYGLY